MEKEIEGEEEVVVETPQEEVVVPSPEIVEEEVDWKTKAEEEAKARAKAEELAQNQRIRAEKAEKKAKDSQKESKGLSYKDTLALSNAKVHEDDVDEVLEYAKFKGISVSEALKTTVLKSSLAEKAEQRQTAEATSTGRARSGQAAKTGEALLDAAQRKGELPDSDADLEKLLDARYNKPKS